MGALQLVADLQCSSLFHAPSLVGLQDIHFLNAHPHIGDALVPPALGNTGDQGFTRGFQVLGLEEFKA